MVTRDRRRGRQAHVSVECECDWEPEHGLQIVVRDGAAVTKVGPFDGHLTNAAAYANDALHDVIYHPTLSATGLSPGQAGPRARTGMPCDTSPTHDRPHHRAPRGMTAHVIML
jgi:hypothetical protein